MRLADRFWAKVEKSDGCWRWTSATWGSGYGFFWIGGQKRSEYAHRVSWELANGAAVPNGQLVLHTCDNKLCVNPSHLFLGSHADNKHDSMRKGRHCFGEKNLGGGKLTALQAKEIHGLLGKLPSRAVGGMYGINKSTVLQIWKGRLWTNATGVNDALSVA